MVRLEVGLLERFRRGGERRERTQADQNCEFIDCFHGINSARTRRVDLLTFLLVERPSVARGETTGGSGAFWPRGNGANSGLGSANPDEREVQPGESRAVRADSKIKELLRVY